jgi:hypothetical protein
MVGGDFSLLASSNAAIGYFARIILGIVFDTNNAYQCIPAKLVRRADVVLVAVVCHTRKAVSYPSTHLTRMKRAALDPWAQFVTVV